MTIDHDPHCDWGIGPADQMLLALDMVIQHPIRIQF